MTMQIIKHRVNLLSDLHELPPFFGAEIDLRTHNGELILEHDPFKPGELFEEWLSSYNHGTLILNVKEEGLEGSIQKLLREFNIHDYFFLDQSIPFLIKTIHNGDHRCAVRFSEYESIETLLRFEGKAAWVWIDCFSEGWFDERALLTIKEKFKMCFVSPELQGRFNPEEIHALRTRLVSIGISEQAVCTKLPKLWVD